MKTSRLLTILIVALFAWAGLPSAFASKAVANRAYVQSGPDGVFYARCIPKDNGGSAGSTDIYRVKSDGDELVDHYDWYSAPGVILGWSPIAGKVAVMALHRGEPTTPDNKQVEISIHLGGKLLKSWTTADLVRLGAEIHPDRATGGKRAEFQVVGCEQIEILGSNEYAFTLRLSTGRLLFFNILTGDEYIPLGRALDFKKDTAMVTPKPDAIDQLVAKLSATHGMWRNGLFQDLKMPESASPEQIVEQFFKMRHVTDYKILQSRSLQINGDAYTASEVQTDLGKKVVLFTAGGRWNRAYDADEPAKTNQKGATEKPQQPEASPPEQGRIKENTDAKKDTDLKAERPSAEAMALVKGLIVKGTVKQAIGQFGGFSRLQVGATFELDLSNLPEEKMLFTLLPSNPQVQPINGGYIPLTAPIEIVKVKKSGRDRVVIYLAANDSHGKFLIQIIADLPPKPGSWCSVLLYREGIGGFISSSMAEAGGEITVKDSVAANLPPKAGEQNKPNAQQWPPPLDEKRIIGTWVRKNQPSQGVENHTLLILREDHSWNEAEISGPLTEPVRFKKFAPDSKWEVANVGEKNTQTMLLFKHKEGGSNVWNILKVGAEELDTSGFGPSIIDLRHYTRCDAQTAAKLNERLNQKETEPTAK